MSLRIAVIGAGIAGVTSAYELSAEGHQVTVFERRGSVAAEGSFANAGLVVPGLVLAWTPPRAPRLTDGQALAWQWQRWRAGRNKNAGPAHQNLLQLALHSSARLQQLRRRVQLDYEHTEGQLVLLRGPAELAAIQPGLALLQAAGVVHHQLDADQCRTVEPGLNPDAELYGGIRLAQAEIGNCRQFAHLLRLEAQRLGTQFRFHTTVRSVQPGRPVRLTHEYTPPVERSEAASRLTDAGDTEPAPLGIQQEAFDAVIVCAALDSVDLLAPLGLKLPLTAVHGHAITAPLRQLEAYPDLGPRAGVFDHQQQIAISRIGQRVRVAGVAEVGGRTDQFKPASLNALHQVLHQWFPGSIQNGQAQHWKAVLAQLPDGLPVLGASGLPGLWLNLAQGGSHSQAAINWTLACGAAHVLAAQVTGRPSAVDVSGLDISRLA